MKRKREKVDQLIASLSAKAPLGFYIVAHVRFATCLATFRSLPPKWEEEYTGQAYHTTDPIMHWGIMRTGSFRWSDVTLPDPRNVLDAAKSHGINFGAVSSVGRFSTRTICSILRDDREFDDAEIAEVEHIVEQIHETLELPKELPKGYVEILTALDNRQTKDQILTAQGLSSKQYDSALSDLRDIFFAHGTGEILQRAKDYALIA